MIELLKLAKVFRGLSDDHLEMISDGGKTTEYQRNETIINEGQTGHSLFIVIKGQVEVVLPKKAGTQMLERATRIKLSRLAPGDCIGEYSLIDQKPASASVVAIEPCTLFEISRSSFENMVNSSDYLAKTIYKNMLLIMIKRARDSNQELDMCYH